jgi:predicted metallo-beta-lactamase superfamily hydrolase
VTLANLQSLKNQRQKVVEKHKELKKKWKDVVKQTEGIKHKLSIASQSVAELQGINNYLLFWTSARIFQFEAQFTARTS